MRFGGAPARSRCVGVSVCDLAARTRVCARAQSLTALGVRSTARRGGHARAGLIGAQRDKVAAARSHDRRIGARRSDGGGVGVIQRGVVGDVRELVMLSEEARVMLEARRLEGGWSASRGAAGRDPSDVMLSTGEDCSS